MKFSQNAFQSEDDTVRIYDTSARWPQQKKKNTCREQVPSYTTIDTTPGTWYVLIVNATPKNRIQQSECIYQYLFTVHEPRLAAGIGYINTLYSAATTAAAPIAQKKHCYETTKQKNCPQAILSDIIDPDGGKRT